MRDFPPKRQFLQEPHGVTSQKTAFFNKDAGCIPGLVSALIGNSSEGRTIEEEIAQAAGE
jgi:hypothetical protein